MAEQKACPGCGKGPWMGGRRSGGHFQAKCGGCGDVFAFPMRGDVIDGAAIPVNLSFQKRAKGGSASFEGNLRKLGGGQAHLKRSAPRPLGGGRRPAAGTAKSAASGGTHTVHQHTRVTASGTTTTVRQHQRENQGRRERFRAYCEQTGLDALPLELGAAVAVVGSAVLAIVTTSATVVGAFAAVVSAAAVGVSASASRRKARSVNRKRRAQRRTSAAKARKPAQSRPARPVGGKAVQRPLPQNYAAHIAAKQERKTARRAKRAERVRRVRSAPARSRAWVADNRQMWRETEVPAPRTHGQWKQAAAEQDAAFERASQTWKGQQG